MSTQPFSPEHTQIGWIGTGIMGSPMAGFLVARGYKLNIYNRTKAKADSLIDAGCTWVDTPRELAQKSDVIFTILGYPRDVEQVYFGEDGILEGISSGATVVDMTSTLPSLALRIAEACESKGAQALDAPVSGGQAGAEAGKLSVMLGGNKDIAERVRPLLDAFSANVVYQGGAGAGQHAKVANQIVVANTMIGVAEALVYGHRAGLDLETLLQSISKGAAACWTLDVLAPKIINDDFEPGFMVEHLVKDLGVALQEAERMQLALPGTALAKQLYHAVMAMGKGRKGTQALYLALEKLSARTD